jgi:aryl-alcohol dehydrogenase-like predicted oxidoreductase
MQQPPIDPTDQVVTLPGCETPFAPLGVGTWAWGDRDVWGMGSYDVAFTEATIAEAWEASIDCGVTLFDTAEGYGAGESERIIGRLLAQDPSRRSSLVIASKFLPMPQKLDVATSLRASLMASRERLGVDAVDLYQLHGPISLRSAKVLAEALAAVVHDGLVSAVGVSNYSVWEMERIHAELASRGVALASNQIEFSLLRRRPETSGLLEACRRLGVVPLAYSPIGQGRLTGKYSAANPPPRRRRFSAHPMERVEPIVDQLRRIGDAHGRTPSQVALRWTIDKGAVPIPGAKNAQQATDNAGALGWHLEPDEVALLDSAALTGTRTLFQRLWQHG